MRKIPQIGWNEVKVKSSKLKVQSFFNGISDNSYFYFVNSFYCLPKEEITIGLTNYGEIFSSIVKKENIVGVQFHPEKSGPVGFKLLENFAKGANYVS